jgi:hypothetical protein
LESDKSGKACGRIGAQIVDREKLTYSNGKLQRRADLFLNKVVAWLHTGVAVDGETLKTVSGGQWAQIIVL